ncbi:hypothetical protein ZIOFF_033268 [Zingiber officinale]|uniref:dUTP diphosphatase n=1 Tax=Zingiber officinale TaxID=94328 RepID=A0A8J5GQC1_ZINOF|nr:hypothetical protein ZIOFF_033268 [Zingiber officinale]
MLFHKPPAMALAGMFCPSPPPVGDSSCYKPASQHLLAEVQPHQSYTPWLLLALFQQTQSPYSQQIRGGIPCLDRAAWNSDDEVEQVHQGLPLSSMSRNKQVSFLARGYENWQNGETNILVTRGLVGRLSNTPNVGFAYEVQNVVDYLASYGVRALPGRSYNTRDVLGQNWMIRQSTVNIAMQPTEVNTRNLLDGRISLSFNNYQVASITNPPIYNARDEEISSDEEEITNHIITVFTETEREKEELLVRRISATAALPIRRSHGATGYDIAIDKACIIVSRERKLLTTGICIQVPQGLYARLAPRSSIALRGIIIMGGVIDTDYRGDHKALVPQPYSDDECAQEYDFYVAKEHMKSKGKTIRMESSKERLNVLSRKAKDYRVAQHKFYEQEAYLNLVEGPQTLASSISQTARMLQDSREYRRQLQRQLDESPQSSTNFLYLAIPPEECFIILETDGCMEGWGGICKWKRKKDDPRTEEKICAYASGNPSGGNNDPASEEAQYQGIPAPEGPYQLLDQYEELSRSRMPNPRIFRPQEKDLRAHLEDIEWTASRRVLNSIWELKLINNSKEADFAYRGQLRGGLYFQDSLPEPIWELKLINNSKEADFAYRGQLRGGLYFQDSLPEVTKAKEELLNLFIKAQNIIQRIRDTPP